MTAFDRLILVGARPQAGTRLRPVSTESGQLLSPRPSRRYLTWLARHQRDSESTLRQAQDAVGSVQTLSLDRVPSGRGIKGEGESCAVQALVTSTDLSASGRLPPLSNLSHGGERATVLIVNGLRGVFWSPRRLSSGDGVHEDDQFPHHCYECNFWPFAC